MLLFSTFREPLLVKQDKMESIQHLLKHTRIISPE